MSQSFVLFAIYCITLSTLEVLGCPDPKSNQNGATVIRESANKLNATLSKMKSINIEFDSIELYLTKNLTNQRAMNDPIARPLFQAQREARINHNHLNQIIEAFAYVSNIL